VHGAYRMLGNSPQSTAYFGFVPGVPPYTSDAGGFTESRIHDANNIHEHVLDSDTDLVSYEAEPFFVNGFTPTSNLILEGDEDGHAIGCSEYDLYGVNIDDAAGVGAIYRIDIYDQDRMDVKYVDALGTTDPILLPVPPGIDGRKGYDITIGPKKTIYMGVERALMEMIPRYDYYIVSPNDGTIYYREQYDAITVDVPAPGRLPDLL